jgi:hypothetical protein
VVGVEVDPGALPALRKRTGVIALEGSFLDTTPFDEVDLVVGNPPFFLATEFVVHAHELGARRVAFLLPLTFRGGAERARLKLFDTLEVVAVPPTRLAFGGTASVAKARERAKKKGIADPAALAALEHRALVRPDTAAMEYGFFVWTPGRRHDFARLVDLPLTR